MKKRISENKWFIRGVWPFTPISEKSGRDIDKYYITDRIEATVPGGVHYDLFRAGIIENPYYDNNSLKCEWIENRWWLYETDVSIVCKPGKQIFLVFDGLDYGANIYVNNQFVGSHENMFTPAKIDITEVALPETNIKVMLRGVPMEIGQYGRTSDTVTQKSRFGYGWDFATRLVNIGIWKDVWIEYDSGFELLEASINSDYVDKVGYIETKFWFYGKREENVLLKVFDPVGTLISQRCVAFCETIHEKFEIETPQLWYPNGMGQQPLYSVVVECGEVLERYRIGVRSLRYMKNEGAPEGSLPYTVVINGQKVRLKGNNKVPFDHLYGNVGTETYEWYVRTLVNENVNIVRLWGGGIIEKEIFYDLCDENGILVWQDFIQSSSGIENMPSKKAIFLEKLQEAALAAVKAKRNHVSLTFWCGGNELTDDVEAPVGYDYKNIALLKCIVEREDPVRLFLSSTPSGPVYRLDFDAENHDVHGPWEYAGKEVHYQNYNKLRLLLHSEVGISAPSTETAEFLRIDYIKDTDYLRRRHHGGFWWHSYERDIESFDTFESFMEYAPYGQWIQAEGLRYTIESDQRLGNYNSGTMIWQLNEPWPNADCTNLVDYFGNPKMAYYWVKNSFAECGVSLKYNSIVSGDTFDALLCSDCGKAEMGREKVYISYHTLTGEIFGKEEIVLSEFPYRLEKDVTEVKDIFFVRVSCGNITKDYYFSKCEEYPYAPMRYLPKTKLGVKITEDIYDGDILTLQALVRNEGDVSAVFVYPYDLAKQYAILADDAYFTLLPGEEKKVKLTLRKRLGLFFERRDVQPEVVFKAMNA